MVQQRKNLTKRMVGWLPDAYQAQNQEINNNNASNCRHMDDIQVVAKMYIVADDAQTTTQNDNKLMKNKMR